MTAAHYLAEWGAQVYLADNAPYIGGAFLLLDHTFTTDSCGLCIALPCQPSYCPTISSELHPRIAPLTCTRLAALEGEAGRFVATLRHEPRYVDPDRCDNCGMCAVVCPAARPHPYDGALTSQKAIYPPPPRAAPFAYGLDPQACTRCGACVETCPRGAIDLQAKLQEERVEVGAVLLAPGFASFDATRASEFGWGRCANVVTSLQFERMLNRSGPTEGRVVRLSDGHTPRRIAFIHCVGSRNAALGRPYCSTSCCMVVAKQVGLVAEWGRLSSLPEWGGLSSLPEVTVFTMDVRTAGKGYEQYFQRVAALPGVTYRRAMVSAVYEVPGSGNLRLRTPDGEEEFDLAVLAIGLGPADSVHELATSAGVALDEYGFILPGADGPGATTRPGVFAAGAGLAPSDVPETVTQAAAAAAMAAGLLKEGREGKEGWECGSVGGTEGFFTSSSPPAEALASSPPAEALTSSPPAEALTSSPPAEALTSSPPEGGDKRGGEDLADQPPRIGLFLCTCHGALESVLDFPALITTGGRLRAVAHVERLEVACGLAGLAAIERAVREHSLNRIVVAGCSPRLYADQFGQLMAHLSLPIRLLARANVREGAAWPHESDPATATGVARGEIEMAVTGLRETPYRPFSPRPQETVARRVLVLGGGLAGMTAALALADLGVECDLVEREAHLGGNLRESHSTLEGLDVQALLAGMLGRTRRAERVRVWTEAELAGWSGARGDFVAQIRTHDEIHSERYGALVVATGGEPATTTEYLYGQHERVITQRELEQVIAGSKKQEARGKKQDIESPESSIVHPAPCILHPSSCILHPASCRSVVMIQCVASRDEAHPYCSRVCCAQALKNALALKRLDPAIEVTILFRDVRTPGTQELYYRQARQLGVRFLRYEPPAVAGLTPAVAGLLTAPLVAADGDRLRVTVHDTLYDETVTLEAGLLVLSTGIVPRDHRRLAGMLGVPLDEDGFFAEAHPKLRPTDLARPGIFVCGLAYGPRFITETISQARAAALRAALVVARPVESRQDIATVEADLCSFCGLCVTNCPYGARVLDDEERLARVVDHLCQGCGVCVAVCPNGASRQPAFEPVGALALVEAAL